MSNDADHDRRDHRPAAPTPPAALHETENEEAHAAHEREHADHIGHAGRVLVFRLVEDGHCGKRGDGADGYVDPERGAPTPRVDEPATERRPERSRDTADGRPCGGAGAAVRLGKRVEDERGGHRQDERGEDGLDRSRGDEPPGIRGQRRQHRRGGEPDEAQDHACACGRTVRRPRRPR